MGLFSYTARNLDGLVERGTLEAQDANTARASLMEMELDAIELEELPENFTVVETDLAQLVPPWVNPAPQPSVELSHAPRVPKLPSSKASKEYLPLTHTLRLYAGWLLAWYFLIYAFGSLQFLKRFPGEVIFLDELFHSQIILQFTAAAFLFLLLTTMHRLFGGGILKGLILGVLGAGMLALFLQSA